MSPPGTYILPDPGGATPPEMGFFRCSGGRAPPGFLISRRSGGLQKGCFWYFGVSFERFDKFICQNDTAGAMNTPPKWLILLNSGVVIPPERLFFLRFGVVAPRASRPRASRPRAPRAMPQGPVPQGPVPQGISTGPHVFNFSGKRALRMARKSPDKRTALAMIF